MADFGDDFYRENILDHYKSPRNYGELEGADAHAEGVNPLCGDETSISVRFASDGDTIEDIRFHGRGCAISMASTSMLTELVKGRTATEVAEMSKDELLEDLPPLTPVRLKCALLGLTTLRVALHRAKGTPPPEGLAGLDELELK
jgi:nitrogen fixation protein NifU and related proteins